MHTFSYSLFSAPSLNWEYAQREVQPWARLNLVLWTHKCSYGTLGRSSHCFYFCVIARISHYFSVNVMKKNNYNPSKSAIWGNRSFSSHSSPQVSCIMQKIMQLCEPRGNLFPVEMSSYCGIETDINANNKMGFMTHCFQGHTDHEIQHAEYQFSVLQSISSQSPP